jgi:hypothetical protein
MIGNNGHGFGSGTWRENGHLFEGLYELDGVSEQLFFFKPLNNLGYLGGGLFIR